METRVRTWLLVGIGVAVLCAPAQGHHSFAAIEVGNEKLFLTLQRGQEIGLQVGPMLS